MHNRRGLSKIAGITAFIIILFVLPVILNSPYWIHVLILASINVLLVVSLYTIARVGEISLGTGGFMLIGAYGSALLAAKVGLSFWITLLLGGLMASSIALAVGYPFLRTKGIYFSILTLLLAEVWRVITWYWHDLTGGSAGLRNIPSPNPITIPGITTITFDTRASYYYLVLVIVVLSLLILYRMERSKLGLTWAAIKEVDNLAASVGINVMLYKILVFSVACFFMGISGALFAHYIQALSPDFAGKFGFMTSIFIVVYMVIGGADSFIGPIIGAVILTIIPEIARPLKEFQPLIFAGLLILTVFAMPEGLIGLRDRLPFWYRNVVGKLKTKGAQ